MTKLNRLAIGAVLALGAASIATAASARVVCVGDDCWHAKETYDYPASSRVVIHEDGWTAGPHVRWREHESRGYWRGDRWEDF
ncbi:hypothetical protein MMMDOFMJ_4385 [Methylobacterium gnaphalii]|uniref:Lipoprotein n=1 Tax=Methylobacterium gnaphalii TaxID=1010610 RepID=A0A512JRA2_9HYPH|nr:hypothetical protein MGN01_43320 [Methylobacterium gnaphalii]GJD71426.1 hypothetical protein MMMDOFMJ_4385 [Methylobacterium gnaphalii]GLS50607.1 hypothetical protein GCM10007885_34600 [Methylobacterium gnaphalii]